MSDDSDLPVNTSRSSIYVGIENGHYSSSSDSDSTATYVYIDGDDDDNHSEEFDTNLPTIHKYLGKMNNVGGYTLYDEGQIIDSMLAVHTNTMVFPGFTLPLVMREFEDEHLLEDMKKGYTFVLIFTDKNMTQLFDYGVIMEVFETSDHGGTFSLKAKARQRCEIIPGQHIRVTYPQKMQKISVKVVGEPNIKSPIENTQLQTLRLRRFVSTEDYETVRNNKYRRYHLSQYPYASWVYDHNELSFYVKFISEGLMKYYMKEQIPRDPVPLSYWFVQNFQLTHKERLDILKCNSVLERLRLELKFLAMERMMICKCSVDIASQKDVFAMSKDGVQSNYCNPGGQVYETITVMEAQNYKLYGPTSKQFTWFPGYSWTIIQCRYCKCHLGWQFTSKSHHPQKFFGLANSCLDIKITSNSGEDMSEDDCVA